MIRLENISKYYHNVGIVTLGLRNVNLHFRLGEFAVITGESGSGKTTLLNVISGVDSYEDGEMYVAGKETSYYDARDWEEYRRDKIGFIFQNYNLIDSFTVLKNVEASLVIQGVDRKTRRRRALEIIRRVGLESHIRHRAARLSGGQKQRLAIARALAKNTPVIVADEPTGNLDSKSGAEIFKLLHEISQERLVIVVTHDYEAVAAYATRKIRLFDGEIVEDAIFEKRELPLPEEREEIRVSPARQALSLSFMGLLGQPKKTIFTFLVILAMVFFTFTSLGGYLLTVSVEYDDGVHYIYPVNDYPERLLVVRKDRGALTAADKEKILGVSDVASVIEEDMVVDLAFEITYELGGYPQLRFGRFNFVSEFKGSRLRGRMPEKAGEILLSMYVDEEDVDKIPALLDSYVSVRYASDAYPLAENYKVVGVYLAPKEGPEAVISAADRERLNEILKVSQAGYEIIFVEDERSYNYEKFSLVVDENLEGYEAAMNDDFFEGADLYIAGQKMERKPKPGGEYYVIYISPEFFEELRIPEQYQYTVNLKDPDKADSAINKLYNLGYYAMSPARSDPIYRLISIPLAIFGFFGIAVNLFVIFILTYVIIRAILLSKKRDYAIFRILGLPRGRIILIILLELLINLAFAYALMTALVIAMPSIHSELAALFSKMGFRDYLTLVVIDAVLIFLIAYRFNKYIAKRNLFSELKGDE